jgi:hypothetical protein
MIYSLRVNVWRIHFTQVDPATGQRHERSVEVLAPTTQDALTMFAVEFNDCSKYRAERIEVVDPDARKEETLVAPVPSVEVATRGGA